MSADPTRKPKTGPIPLPEPEEPEDLRPLEEEAAALKARLDDVTARLLKAIAGKNPRPHIEALEGTKPGFRPRRVLIIEDDLEVRDVLRNLLLRLGHIVDVASNGVDGLVAMHDFKPELAFVDLGLPDLDGFAVARGIRESLGSNAPVLVAYTADTSPNVKAAALAAGFDRHVPKPIAMDELLQLLQPQLIVRE